MNSVKLKKLEKFIDPLTKEYDWKIYFWSVPINPRSNIYQPYFGKSFSKLIEMKQHNERSGSASPTGETECTMNSLRSIVKGSYNFVNDQFTSYEPVQL